MLGLLHVSLYLTQCHHVSGLYIGHRNVSRMIVLRTEVFGAIFVIITILLWSLMFHFIYKARMESNKWRASVRVGITRWGGE